MYDIGHSGPTRHTQGRRPQLAGLMDVLEEGVDGVRFSFERDINTSLIRSRVEVLERQEGPFRSDTAMVGAKRDAVCLDWLKGHCPLDNETCESLHVVRAWRPAPRAHAHPPRPGPPRALDACHPGSISPRSATWSAFRNPSACSRSPRTSSASCFGKAFARTARTAATGAAPRSAPRTD